MNALEQYVSIGAADSHPQICKCECDYDFEKNARERVCDVFCVLALEIVTVPHGLNSNITTLNG